MKQLIYIRLIKIILKMQQSPERAGTFHMPKVSFTDTFGSSLSDKEEKYTLDRNLARGILQNKPELIVEQHQQSLLVEQAVFDQQEEIHKIAIDYRNKYDRTKNESTAVESRIEALKEQISRLQTSSDELSSNKRQTSEKCKDMQRSLIEQTQMVSQTQMRLDGSKHMNDRLSEDILFYRKKYFDCNIQLIKLRSEKKRYGDHSHRQEKLNVRCKTLLTSVEGKLHQNQHQRKRGLYQINGVLGTKNEVFIKQHERQDRLQRSMLAALSEKLTQQKELSKLFYVNKFLKAVLRSKMDTLMAQNKQINDAFCNIKQHTTVRSVDQFVSKFLKKEEVYGSLLQSIALAEPKIQLIKKQSEQLKQERMLIEHEKDEIDEKYKQIYTNNIERQLGEVAKIDLQLQQIDKFKNSLLNWTVSTIAMFRGVPRLEVRSRYTYLADMLKDCLSLLRKTTESFQDKDMSIAEEVLSKQVQKTKIEANQYFRRNVRIKTVGNEVKQEDDIDYDLLSQKDFLHGARRAVKKKHLGHERVRLLSRY